MGLLSFLTALGACGNGGNYTRPSYAITAGTENDEALSLWLEGQEVQNPLTLYTGESLPLELRGGNSGGPVAWYTSNVSVAQFPSPGILLGVNPGNFTVRVHFSGQRIEMAAQVLPGSPPEIEKPEVSQDPNTPENPEEAPSPDPEIPDPVPSDPFMDEVVEFLPGPHAGFGGSDFPNIVLGGPQGQGLNQGGFDVLSLGAGGSIVLKSDSPIMDGPGPDFIVFENPFQIGGNPNAVFVELGEISVSQNGVEFFTYSCDFEDRVGGFSGCAGHTPVLANVLTNSIDPTDPESAGGDAFDLEDLGLPWVRYVRIQDLSDSGSGTNAGFDLDAVAIVHP